VVDAEQGHGTSPRQNQGTEEPCETKPRSVIQMEERNSRDGAMTKVLEGGEEQQKSNQIKIC